MARRKRPNLGKRKDQHKAGVRHKSRRKQRKPSRRVARPRKSVSVRHKSQRKKRQSKADRRLETAVREMNRGRSLSATARALGFSAKDLQKQLKSKRLITRKGSRWVAKDNRLRQVPVMSGGRFRALTVRGFKPANIVSRHYSAVNEFVRTNNLELLKPFEGQAIQGADGRRYALETDPNALHRIAAMDSPPFHEIYEIASRT